MDTVALTDKAAVVPAYQERGGASTHPWNALFEPDLACLCLPALQKLGPSYFASLLPALPPSLRIIGNRDVLLEEANTLLPKELVGVISALLMEYERFMSPPIMRVRLELIRSNACWKWHQDFTTLRLITTLLGDGTEYLPNPSNQDEVRRCGEGEIGLFKGRLFGDYFDLDGHDACVHRSPPWDAQKHPRILLVIDMPQDFEIEHSDV
ncbi:MAG: DUF1826 domain-containing protein [Pseudomonadota bacterium]